MITKNSYYIKRNGIYIWLSVDSPVQDGDEVIEVRPMLIADEGKELWKDGINCGSSLWVKDTTGYEERDIEEEDDGEH